MTFHDDESALDRRYDLVVASSSLQYGRGLAVRCSSGSRRRPSGYLYVARVPVALAAPSFVVIQRPYVHGYDTEYLGWVLNRERAARAAPPARARVPPRRAFLGRRRAGGSGGPPELPVQSVTTVSIYADLYRYRELFGNLFRRDLQTRYKGSVARRRAGRSSTRSC